ncbi:MAG: NUDIX hydrolase [Chloroflexota bacterium]
MPEKVEIITREEVFNKAIFRVEQATLRHEKYDGSMSEEISRLNLDRGDSVAAVIHIEETDEIILIEQFRFSTYDRGPGWIIELPAGMIRDGERPEDSMRRELVEETGYTVISLRPISTFYVSPGGTSERIHLFYARIQQQHKTGEGGGVEEEAEDIRTVLTPLSSIETLLAMGHFSDAKTIIGLQWLLMNRDQLTAY